MFDCVGIRKPIRSPRPLFLDRSVCGTACAIFIDPGETLIGRLCSSDSISNVLGACPVRWCWALFTRCSRRSWSSSRLSRWTDEVTFCSTSSVRGLLVPRRVSEGVGDNARFSAELHRLISSFKAWRCAVDDVEPYPESLPKGSGEPYE